ncbi:Metalloreductase STEAP4 [Amphibalanus amphitrite]|uniref:Metalloreductase STEAP4 n=1 Tax=Amphibalanus amphitrite TaxID=1232801 RepID=A0A6A4VXT8_AMPAM|nr:Metalloreductase STEAP4 [Amphibalanus amphitrite]
MYGQPPPQVLPQALPTSALPVPVTLTPDTKEEDSEESGAPLPAKEPPESVNDPPESVKESEERHLSVLGAGDYGRALAGRAALCGWRVTLGSRRPTRVPALAEDADVTVVSTEKAAAAADLLVVCVPAHFYHSLPLDLLANKVVVDVSNGVSAEEVSQLANAERLQALAPTAKVVKAFNVVSAYALERGLQAGKQVMVAGESASARRRVAGLVSDLGFFPVDSGGLRAARRIETLPLQLFPAWRVPGLLCLLMFMLSYIYLLLSDQVCLTAEAGGPWTPEVFQPLLMVNINKALAMTAGTTLAATYLAGVVAAYLQLLRGTKYRRFPGWLDNWLRMRKQLGLLMLAMAAMHACMSAAVWSPRYLPLAYQPPTLIEAEVVVAENETETQQVAVFNRGMHWRGETFLSAGAVALSLLSVIGITSLPSVGASLSWREFMFVQSGLGWAALVAATAHALVLALTPQTLEVRCMAPPPLQVSLYLPVLTVLLKLPLLVPPVARHLSDIRGGHERRRAAVAPASPP